MKKLLMFVLLLFWTVPISAQVDTAWVRRYNGPGNEWDNAWAIAVDNSGNVYVTGWSWGSATSEDYATIKYNASGNQVWVERYNGPGNGSDVAWSIAVDNSGNVYVTGQSWGSGTGGDYATIKYGSNGSEIWVRRYNGSANGQDSACAIAVDPSGNVYVTGGSWGGGTMLDYATVKYDPSGNQVWLKRYDGPGNQYDEAYAIAADNSGNIYVTGRSYGGSDPSFDYATIKYNASGNQVWVKRYDGNDYDGARDITLDNSGNVYVTGGSDGSGTGEDYATIKYDASGNQVWVKRYNGPGNGYDLAWSIAIDNSGNVYVTGESWGIGTNYDYATIKYDASGNEVWVKRYNGNDYDGARDITLDNSGNVYVTGSSWGSGTSYDYATIKYEEGDLYISDVKPIQVVWDPSAFVVDKKTMVKVIVQNTFPSSKYVKFRVTYNYGQNTYVENGPGGSGVLVLPGENEVYLPGGATTESQTAWSIGNEFKWTSAGTESNLQVEVDPYNNVTEINESNNIGTSSPIVFQESGDLKVRYYKLKPSSDCTKWETPLSGDFRQTADTNTWFIHHVWPIKWGGIIQSISYDFPFDASCDGEFGMKTDMMGLDFIGWWDGVDRAVGVVGMQYFTAHDHSNWDGVSFSNTVSSLVTAGYWTAAAHEIHHNLPPEDDWRQGDEEYEHKFCLSGENLSGFERCYGDGDCPPPYTCGWLYPSGNPSFGVQMWNHRVIEFPKYKTCFMGECSFRNANLTLVCDDCYEHLLTHLKKGVLYKSALDTAIYVSGTVYRNGGGVLERLFAVPDRQPRYNDSAAGEYAVRLIDAAQQTILNVNLDLRFRVSSDTGWVSTDVDGFAIVLPFSSQVAAIQLLHMESVLNQKAVSANAPSIILKQPNGGEQIMADSSFIAIWSSYDLDGDSLHYLIQISPDDGQNWYTVEDNMLDTQCVIRTDHLLPSDSYRLRAIASDGVRTGTDDSDSTFSVILGYLQGDANGDGLINSADVSYLINYLFVNGPAPNPLGAGDANCDGNINSADVAYLINYLFVGGPPPGC
jgi:hypothetical protein